VLGCYNDFPRDASCFAQFAYVSSVQELQTAMVKAFCRLNQQAIDLGSITAASPIGCSVNFEFGIADTDAFYFVDKGELSKLENAIKVQSLPILDVFCAARYSIKNEKGQSRTKSLQFDYNVLRFTFEKENIELLLHYIRGIQRIPRKDFILFLKNQINWELAQEQHEALTMKSLF